MSLIAKVDRLPPFLCRYVARKKHGHEPMSHTDIAKASGLSRSFVAELSRRRSWKGIPIDVVDKFSQACGVNLSNPSPTFKFLRKTKKQHVYRATRAQKIFISSLFTQKKKSDPDLQTVASC